MLKLNLALSAVEIYNENSVWNVILRKKVYDFKLCKKIKTILPKSPWVLSNLEPAKTNIEIYHISEMKIIVFQSVTIRLIDLVASKVAYIFVLIKIVPQKK